MTERFKNLRSGNCLSDLWVNIIYKQKLCSATAICWSTVFLGRNYLSPNMSSRVKNEAENSDGWEMGIILKALSGLKLPSWLSVSDFTLTYVEDFTPSPTETFFFFKAITVLSTY